MKSTPRKMLLLSAFLAIGVSGCASLQHTRHWATVWPVIPRSGSEHQASDADTYYLNASSAIYRRNYALALDMLQVARMKAPGDVRVLNAFGVVYDKLGRFDLSARYYREAAALDPNSSIVSNNLAYSERLQGKVTAAPTLASAEPAKAAEPSRSIPAALGRDLAANPPSQGRVVVMGPGVVRLDLPSAPAPVQTLAVLTGHALTLVNASGRSDGGDLLRNQLVSLGWSAPMTETASRTARDTTVRYPSRNLLAAQALARTLPGRVVMAACDDDCTSISLIIGSDALGWKLNTRGGDKHRS